MNEHDIIRYMGRFPDKIITDQNERLISDVWKCSKCGYIVRANAGTKITIPAPCPACGSIFFETVIER